MRIIGTIVVAAFLGIMAGAALAYIEVHSDPNSTGKLLGNIAEPPPAANEKSPRIQVPELNYDFGTMQRGTSKSHDFLIRNVGSAPLKLRSGGTTCKCTLSKVPDEPIPPGGSTSVKLEWTAKADGGPFRQTATILTNDSIQSQVDLIVDGQIMATSGVMPPDFIFDKVSVGETKTAQVFIMAMLQDDISVHDPQFSDPTVRDKFDVKIEPVDRAELPNKQARSGVRVTVTAKPGLPVGRFHSWLTLHTNMPETEKLDIPVVGQVVGDISLHGTVGWNEEQGTLTIGSVNSSKGGHGKIFISVRGAGAGNVKFDVHSVDPPELKVTIGKPRQLKDSLVMVPVDIEIPPGTRPMVHLDTAQGDAARIVFSTTHPAIKELSLSVKFAVER